MMKDWYHYVLIPGRLFVAKMTTTTKNIFVDYWLKKSFTSQFLRIFKKQCHLTATDASRTLGQLVIIRYCVQTLKKVGVKKITECANFFASADFTFDV
jgi:hypothetical protein